MTPRELKPMSAYAIRAASALREAGEDGIGYADLRDALGIPPKGPLEELRRHGFVVGEQLDTYFLVHEPVSSEPPVSAAQPPAERVDSSRPRAGGSLDAAPTLFDPLRMAA